MKEFTSKFNYKEVQIVKSQINDKYYNIKIIKK